jgi:hypothetical protein
MSACQFTKLIRDSKQKQGDCEHISLFLNHEPILKTTIPWLLSALILLITVTPFKIRAQPGAIFAAFFFAAKVGIRAMREPLLYPGNAVHLKPSRPGKLQPASRSLKLNRSVETL